MVDNNRGDEVRGIDNPAATEENEIEMQRDVVIRVQPSSGDIQLPVSTIDWQSNPRGQFILVQGLDFLIGVSKLLIQQTVELDDLTSRIESENRYIVRVPNGEALYFANETSTSTQRCLCGTGRAFVMRLHDNTRQEALVLHRRLASSSCCFPCRLQEMTVTVPPGDPVGRIQQQWTWMVPFFLVRDASDRVLFVIEGPAVFRRSALISSVFRIMSGDSLLEMGRIVHAWDTELVSFTTTVDMPNVAVQPKHKALLLAAGFLLEYTYFERANSKFRNCSCF
ncbi:unnamed protein product [Arctia plantaginis]|uniref:Phospholipid scramblase n=1 Tax=Arctia plantaginis TaxID=874455 RepID=A0A8S1A5F7_ARCPL|nr:unnamed protein product [Arctia plantaginis]